MFLPTNPRPHLRHLDSTPRALAAQASRIRVTAVDENMPSRHSSKNETTRFVGMRQVLVGSRASRCVVPRWAHPEGGGGTMRRAITFVSLVLVAGLLQIGGADAAPPVKFSPGDKGVGDPYFPLDGNGGYDVEHYALELQFDPATGELDGV